MAQYLSRGAQSSKSALSSWHRLLARHMSQKGVAVGNPLQLCEVLAQLPRKGVGARVFQTRWATKGIEGCCWDVTRVKLKEKSIGMRGKAWGFLVWRGKRVSEKEEKITGAFKYKWSEGFSRGSNLPLVQPMPDKLRIENKKVQLPVPKELSPEEKKAQKRREFLQKQWNEAILEAKVKFIEENLDLIAEPLTEEQRQELAEIKKRGGLNIDDDYSTADQTPLRNDVSTAIQ